MAVINKPQGLSRIWADLGEKREPSDTKIQQGWVAEIPTYQDFNWLDGRQDQFIAHTNQRGIPEWDNTTEYQSGKSYIQGSDGNIYKCITTNTNNDPTSDTTKLNWKLYNSDNEYTPTLSNGYTQGTLNLKASVSAGRVHFNGSLNVPNPLISSDIATLPIIYRPLSTQLISACQIVGGTTSSPIFLEFKPDGVLKVWGVTPNVTAGAVLYIDGSSLL